MPRSSLPLFRSLFVFLLAIWVLAPVVGNAGSNDRRSLTGVWVTKPASRFVLQDVGGPVRESTIMRWELEEDEDGLITGYNSYFSTDDDRESPSRGTLCMVGARIGNRVVLEEAYAIFNGEPVPDLRYLLGGR